MTAPIAVPGLHELPFAIALRESQALYGAVETMHLFGVTLLVGPVIAFDLSVLGWGRAAPVATLARHLLPLALVALVFIIPSGLAMFATHADELLEARNFFLKMLLVLLGGILAVAFPTGPYRTVNRWNTGVVAPISARLIAIGSILGWLSVLFLGATLR